MNEDDLCRLATSLGFFVAEPEKLTAAEQVQLFHGAEKVIGLGGAGMFNAIFCKAGTQLLDIESTNAFLDGHSQLFASADLDYGIIVGSEDRTDARSDHRRWTLDLARLGPLIEGFFK